MEIVGVLLAAGRGRRMGCLGDDNPKPTLPVLNRSLLHHQLRLLEALGVSRVFAVVWHLREKIVAELERQLGPNMTLQCVDQTDPQGISHALGLLAGRIKIPFVVILGDVYLHAPRLHEAARALARPEMDAVLVTCGAPDPEGLQQNFSVHVSDEGWVCRVVEKPRAGSGGHQGCGIYFFKPSVFDAVKKTPRGSMRNEYEITDTLRIMVSEGQRIIAMDVADVYVNLTWPDDLVEINVAELRRLGLANLVHPDADVAPGATLDGCVVGSGASVERGAHLTNCVVLPGARVPASAHATAAILAGTREIRGGFHPPVVTTAGARRTTA